MIVELGHFALILALLLALAQDGVRAGRRCSWATPRWMAVDPSGRGRAVGVRRDSLSPCLAHAFYRNDFSVLYVAQNSNSALPTFYRFAAVWGAHEGSLLLWAFALATWTLAVAAFSRQAADDLRRARARRAGRRQRGVPAVHTADLESLRAAGAGRRRRQGPQSAPAGLRARDSSADALHRLRRLLGRICIRRRRDARRPARCALGTLDAALDDARLAVPHDRHRARQLVGVLRARLGRLVVLGPGRECLVHALARGYGADPFARGDREARAVPELDTAAGDHRVLAEPARHLPRTLRRARSPCTPSPAIRRAGCSFCCSSACASAGSLLLYAWRGPGLRSRRLRAGVARDLPALQQRSAGGRDRR